MEEILKDKYGRKLATIKDEYGKKVIYDVYGRKLAYYDGKYTYNIYGVRVGEGNFLVLFIKDKIYI